MNEHIEERCMSLRDESLQQNCSKYGAVIKVPKLLIEQPIKRMWRDGFNNLIGTCPSCGTRLKWEYNQCHCGSCGQLLKWNK